MLLALFAMLILGQRIELCAWNKSDVLICSAIVGYVQMLWLDCGPVGFWAQTPLYWLVSVVMFLGLCVYMAD